VFLIRGLNNHAHALAREWRSTSVNCCCRSESWIDPWHNLLANNGLAGAASHVRVEASVSVRSKFLRRRKEREKLTWRLEALERSRK